MQGEKKREKASEDEVDCPQYCLRDAVGYIPVCAASLDVLIAVGQGKDLVCIGGLGERITIVVIYHFTVLARRGVNPKLLHIARTDRSI